MVGYKIMAIRTRDYRPELKYAGDGVLGTDDAGNKIIVFGTTVPSDASSGYATGCLFMKTDGGAGTSLYVNEGSATSSDFDAVTVA